MEQPSTPIHLHRDDVPGALGVLVAVLGRRLAHGERVVGYETTDTGALVEWATLGNDAGLSSTEVACVHIARGLSTLERSGGPAPHMVPSLTEAFANVVPLAEWTATTR